MHLHHKVIHLSPPQTLAAAFLIAIIFGTGLLMLPFSTTTPITWIDALFTATSAITVTGLAVVDTGTQFTVFGQIVILLLIQLGGLGLMTFAVLIILILGKKVGLKNRILVQEALNQTSLGGLIRLVKILLLFTLVIEGAATVLLSFRLVPEYGWLWGSYVSLFHAVSAFNNAGFSLWADNIMQYVGDPVINLVLTTLIITGGIGFTVLYNVRETKTFRQLTLHSKLMLVGTFVVNVVATLVIFLLEYGNPATLGSLGLGEKMWASYFQAVTTRTAGFNSIDIGGLNSSTVIFMIALMFIGAGSASTGGGIKLTTFIVIIMTVWAFLKGKRETVLFERTIKQSIITRALAISTISLLFVFLAIFLLTITEKAPLDWILFEAFSAFGTVGLSMGLTPELSNLGKEVIIVMMFIGRIGPLTLAFSLARSAPAARIRYPEEEIMTG